MIDYVFRSKVSNASSPTTSVASVVWSVRSPPATRLRCRQVSEGVGTNASQTKPTSGRASADRSSKGKAKAKVEFKANVEVHQKKSVRHSKNHNQHTTESDLTELEELEKSLALGSGKQAILVQPSPRRLRSKDRQQASAEPPAASHPQRKPTAPRRGQDTRSDAKSDNVNGWKKIRVLPSRKAKSITEDTKEDEAEDELSDEVDAEEADSRDEEAEDPDLIEEGDDDAISKRSSSEEEIDELASAASSPIARRTPLRKRLRPRRKIGSAGPSDGDDEGDGGEVQSVVDEEMLDQEDEDGGDMDDAETDTTAERVDDEDAIAVEPRKLRSGKIVGEDDVHMDDEEDIGEEDDEDEDEDEEDEDIAEAEEGEDEGGDEVEDMAEEGEDEGGDEDAEGETDEEAMDEEGQFICLNTLVQP